MHGGINDEQRFSPLDQINTGNISSLGLAWAYELDSSQSQEATPPMVDGVLYTTSWSKVVALEAATWRKLWKYDSEVPCEKSFWCCAS